MITASKTLLATKCLWWARGDVTLPKSTASRAAQLGRDVHAAIEAWLRGTPIEPVGEVGEYVEAWVAGWYRWHGAKFWAPEVAYAYAPLTNEARILETKHARDYSSASGEEICGTVDAVKTNANDCAIVDWKTGRRRGAAENAQLLTLAVMVAAHERVDAIEATSVHISPGSTVEYKQTLDEFDLAAHREVLSEMLGILPKATPQPGPWCRSEWCPAYGVCSETSGALVQISPPKRSIKIAIRAEEIENAEHASHLFEYERRAKARLELLSNALRCYARHQGEIPTSLGTWGPREVTREEIAFVRPITKDILSDALSEYARDAIVETTSKKAIEGACKLRAKERGEDAVKLRESVFERLRESGDMVTTVSTRFEEKEAKK